MKKFDVIVVGARCAGAPLATHLARNGVRTLLLDSARLPSDHVLSTHCIHAPGMDALDDLGVGERVRAEAPPMRTVALRVDDSVALVRHPAGREGYCIRRFKLDTWLQEAAVSAGAELRDRSRVTDLVRDGERVAGVVVETPRGRETIRAGFVVGADGVSSTVARLTGVEEYLGSDWTRGGYWSYWPAPACWKDGRFGYDSLIAYEGDGMRYVFQTDGDLLLLAGGPPNAEARSWGGAHRERHVEYLRASPLTAPLVENNAPVGKIIGYLQGRFYYRRPVGPGFALVGDAGNYKDFVTGHGITDALFGARRLADAILDGREEALMHYWRERDASTIELYLDALSKGAVGFNSALSRLIIRKVGESEELSARLSLVTERRLSPFDLAPPSRIAGWVFGEVLRGRFGVVAPFLRVGKRMRAFREEAAHRRALADEARARLAAKSRTAQIHDGVPHLAPST
jgi:flavin-dependent dehydrogenase